ncbi:hypothetical protein BH11ARM1_BH11ARM1_05790 [soil metagenome]
MTQAIPNWWLYLSGAFFLVNGLLFVALIFAVIKMLPARNALTGKVGDLTTKIESVAERVEEVAKNVGETVGSVGAKTTGILGSVELIAQSASRQFEKFSPYLVGAMTAMKLVKSLNEMRAGKDVLEATKKKTLTKKPASKPAPKKRFGIF